MKMMMIAHCETANDNDERFVILCFVLKHNIPVSPSEFMKKIFYLVYH